MSHCKKLVTTAVFLVFFLLVPQNGGALTPTFYRQGEYERLGRVMDSTKFGKTMLEVNGYLQLPVKIIPDPEARQAWPLRSPYTNTACAAYVAESRQSTGNTVEIVDYQTASARIWAEAGKDIFELPDTPFLHLKDSYENIEGNRYRLTPIETRAGDIVKREWCLEPDKTYTLAIFDLGETLPSGKSFSALHFYFTDLIPRDQLARAEDEPCQPHYFRDESTGVCIRPMATTVSTPTVPVDQWVPFVRIYLLMIFLPWLYNLIRFYQYRKRKIPFSGRKLSWIPLVDIYFAVKMAGKSSWWYLAYWLIFILGTAITATSFRAVDPLPADLWMAQSAILVIIFALVGQLHWKIARHHLPHFHKEA